MLNYQPSGCLATLIGQLVMIYDGRGAHLTSCGGQMWQSTDCFQFVPGGDPFGNLTENKEMENSIGVAKMLYAKSSLNWDINCQEFCVQY